MKKVELIDLVEEKFHCDEGYSFIIEGLYEVHYLVHCIEGISVCAFFHQIVQENRLLFDRDVLRLAGLDVGCEDLR